MIGYVYFIVKVQLLLVKYNLIILLCTSLAMYSEISSFNVIHRNEIFVSDVHCHRILLVH